MCTILKDVYRKIFDEPFEYAVLDKRIKLQKAVYFMENLGLHVGDYSFSWDKYGPYSVRLNGDAFHCDKLEEKPDRKFSDAANNVFGYIKDILSKKANDYTDRYWVECIASIHFLKNTSHYEKDDIFRVLTVQKPYLNSIEANNLAYGYAEKLNEIPQMDVK